MFRSTQRKPSTRPSRPAARRRKLFMEALEVRRVLAGNPIASFVAAPAPSAPGQEVTFDGGSSSHEDAARSIVQYAWDFDDDNVVDHISSDSNAVWMFDQFGNFPVSLMVTDDLGATDAAVQNVLVSLGNSPPVANANGPYSLPRSGDLALDASNSFDPDLSNGDMIVRYDWDLDGDGIYDVGGADLTLNVTTAELTTLGLLAGDHTITLRATDSLGAEGFDTTVLGVVPTIISTSFQATGTRFVETTSLTIAFSEHVDGITNHTTRTFPGVGAISVPAHFQLHASTGQEIPLAGGVTYDGATNSATISFESLAAGSYTLTVGDGITDGNLPLDGDDNGIAGGDFTANFLVSDASFGSLQVGDDLAALEVSPLTAASPIVTPHLDVWIDWNQDGDWDDVEEHVASRSADVGVNTLYFSVPDDALAGQSAARFWLHESSVSGEPTMNGELTGEVQFTAVTVDQATVSRLLQDLNTSPRAFYEVERLQAREDSLYFLGTAGDSSRGTQYAYDHHDRVVWKHSPADGESGVVIPETASSWATVGDTSYFTIGTAGDLYKFRVGDASPSLVANFPYSSQLNLFEVDGRVVFTRYTSGSNQHGLFELDRNTDTPVSIGFSRVKAVAIDDSAIYFHGRSDATQVSAVWRYDLDSGNSSIVHANDVDWISPAGGRVFFGQTVYGGDALWMHTPSSGDVQQIIGDKLSGVSVDVTTPVVSADGSVFFGLEGYGTSTDGLWRYDLDAEELTRVAEYAVGGDESSNLVASGDQLVYIGEEVVDNRYIPRIVHVDLLASATHVQEVPQRNAAYPSLREMAVVDGEILFTVGEIYSSYSRAELWSYDVVAREFQLVQNLGPETQSSLSQWKAVELNDKLYFSAADGVHGEELWSYDGTTGDIALVADINPGAADASPRELVIANNKLFFSANDGLHGSELWVFDPATSLATIVADIEPGSGNADVNSMAVIADDTLGERVVFRARDDQASSGFGLYTVNPEGLSVSVHSHLPGDIGHIADAGGGLAHLVVFWASGTSRPFKYDLLANTVTLADSGIEYAREFLASFNGKWYSEVFTSGTGWEVWEYDPVSRNDRILNIEPGINSSEPDNAIVFENNLYFASTDGSSQGTWRIDSSGNHHFISAGELNESLIVDGDLYFTSRWTSPERLHRIRSGSTTVETVVDITDHLPQVSPHISGLKSSHGKIYFSENSYARSYWEYDPQTEELTEVIDFANHDSSQFIPLGTSGDSLVVAADDGVYGYEPWVIEPNVPPIAVHNGPFIVSEGMSLMLDASGSSDPQQTTPLNIAWDLDYDGLVFDDDVVGATPTVVFADNFAARTIAVRVTDEFGVSAVETTTLTVINGDPVITVPNYVTGPVGAPISLAGFATDVASDTLTYTWDFDDNTANASGIDLTEVTHSFVTPGSYNVTLTVTDEDGGSTTESFPVIVGPPVSFDASSQSVSEDTANVSVAVTMASTLPTDAVIPLSASGTAAENDDFALSQSSITIPAGQTTAAVNIMLVDDALSENPESITLTMGQPVGASIGSLDATTITVTDNDPLPRFWLSSDASIVSEDVGQVTLTGQISEIAGRDIFVPITVNSTADIGDDFTLDIPAEIAIPAGSLSSTIAVAILDDDLAEGAETITLTADASLQTELSANAHEPTEQTILIPQNDAPTVSLQGASFSVSENAGSFDVVATLSNPSVDEITVPYSILGNASDPDDFTLSSQSGQFVFAPGDVEETLTIQLVNDSTAELDELIVTALGTPTGAQLGATQLQMVTIADDDSREVSLSTDVNAIWEDGGTFTLTVSLNFPSPLPVTVPFGHYGRLTVNEDFFYLADPIVIPANELSASRTITIIDDTTNEDLEYVTFSMGLPTNADRGSQSSATVSVFDDDPLVSFARPGSYNRELRRSAPSRLESTSEGSSGITYIVTLDESTNKDVSIPVVVTGSAESSDYSISPHPVVIDAGETSALFTFVPTDDTVDEPTESVTLKLGTPTNALSGYDRYRSINIYDNDSEPNIYFDSSSQSVYENNRDVTMQFRLTSPSEQVITKKIYLSGTATNGLDYTVSGLNGDGEIVFPIGSTSASITIHVKEDSLPESDEFVRVHYTSLSSVIFGRAPSRKITIKNDDAHPIADTTPPANSNDHDDWRGRCGSVCDVRDDIVEALRPPKVTWSLHGYVNEGTLFFDANFNRVQDYLDLNENGQHDFGEPLEVGAGTFYDGAAVFEIGPEFDLNANDVIDLSEGQLVMAGGTDVSTGEAIPIALTAPADYPIVSPLSTLVSTLYRQSELSPQDAESRVADSLELASSELLRRDLILDATNGDLDAAVAFSKAIQVYMSVSQIAHFLSGFPSAPSIDFIGHQAFSHLATLSETPGSLLTLSQPFFVQSVIQGVATSIGVNVASDRLDAASQIIAAANAKIDAVEPTPSRAYLEEIVQIQVVAEGDAADRLAEVGSGTADPTQAVADFTSTQLDARAAAAVIGNVVAPYLFVNDAVVVEGDSGQQLLEFEVGIDNASNVPVTVDFATQDLTAAASDGDYVPTSGSLSWAAGDTSTRTVQVSINGDTDLEPDELVQLVLTNAQNAAAIVPIGFGWIVNDEDFSFTPPNDGTPNELLLEFDQSQIILLRNGESIFDGPFTAATQIDITGVAGAATTLTVVTDGAADEQLPNVVFNGQHVDDALFVDDSSASSILHAIAGETSGTFTIDGTEIQYVNTVTVSDLLTPGISGLPSEVDFGDTVTLTSVLPVTDSPSNVDFEWLVTSGGQTLANGDLASVSFDANAVDPVDVSLTVSADGRATSTTLFQFVLATTPPQATDDDFATTENATLSVSSGNGLLTNDTDVEGLPLTVTEIEGQVVSVPAAFTFTTATVDPAIPYLATSINDTNYYGTRFEVTDTLQVERVGGNFQFAFGTGPFAAIVELSGPSDFPDSVDLSTPDVITTTVIPLAFQQDGDVTTDWDVTLSPGWYALMFGTGDFGSTGVTNLLLNNVPQGTPSLIHARVAVPEFRTPTPATNMHKARFVLEGSSAGGNALISLGSGATVTADADGSFTYDPQAAFDHLAAGELGTDTFVYTVTDHGGLTDTAIATIAITGENDPPTAIDDSISVSEENLAAVPGGLLGNDLDDDVLRLVEIGGTTIPPVGSIDIALPSGATVTAQADGTITYDPTQAFNSLTTGETASDSFVYRAEDQQGLSAQATVAVTVNGFNDPPIVFANATATADEGHLATFSGTVVDPEGATVNISSDVGQLTLAADGINWTWEHTVADGDTTLPITLTASDNDGNSDDFSFQFVVNNVAPTIALSGDPTTQQLGTYTLTFGAITDPGVDVATGAIVHWGDGTSTTVSSLDPVSHSYAVAAGDYDIVVDLIDEDGTHPDAGSTTVAVENIAPTISTVTVSETSLFEGDTITLDVLFVDADEPHTVDVNWGDGTTSSIDLASGVDNASVPHVYRDDNPSVTPADQYEILVTVSDAHVSTTATDDEPSAERSFETLLQFSGTNTIDIVDVAYDRVGNLAIVGDFTGSEVQLPNGSGGTTTLSSNGGRDWFVARYAVDGSLTWAHAMGGFFDDRARAIDIATSGEVVVVGSVGGTVDVDPGPVTQTLRNVDAVLSFNGTGELTSAFGIDVTINDVVVVNDGDIVIGGRASFEKDFDPGPGEVLHNPSEDGQAFLARYSDVGEFQWVRGLNGTLDEQVAAVALDASDGIVAVGNFSGEIDLDAGTASDSYTSNGSYDLFVASYDEAGNYRWGVTTGGSSQDSAHDVTVADDNAIYVAAEVNGTLDVDPGGNTLNVTTSGSDPLVWALDYQGALRWGASFSESGNTGTDAIAMSPDGNVVVAGRFTTSMQIGDERVTGLYDPFLAVLTSEGDVAYATSLSGSSFDTPNALAVSPNGRATLAGNFRETLSDADGTQTLTSTTATESDGFLAHYLVAPPSPLVPVVTVSNQEPVVDSLLLEEVNGQPGVIRLAATIHDPGVDDTRSAVITWGDGEETQVTLSTGQTSLEVAHRYIATSTSPADGIHDVTLTLVDDDGGRTTSNTSVAVVPVAEISFESGSITVHEHAGTISIPITLSVGMPQDLMIPITLSGTATNGTDYTIADASVTIASGETSGSSTIAIVDDLIDELESETIVVSLGDVSGVVAGRTPIQTISIVDNDTAILSLTALDDTYQWEDAGTIDLVAKLSVPRDVPTILPIVTHGTATMDLDYTISSPNLTTNSEGVFVTIPAGTAEVPMQVTYIDDDLHEFSSGISFFEFFSVRLSANDLPVQIGDLSRQFVIRDNDPLVYMADPRDTRTRRETGAGEGQDMILQLHLSAPSNEDVVVPLQYSKYGSKPAKLCTNCDDPRVQSGQVAADGDYDGPDSVTIPAGSDRVDFAVPIFQDNLDEPNEQFLIRFGEIENGLIPTYGTREARVSILDDDESVAQVRVPSNVNEGSTFPVTVTLSKQSTSNTFVELQADGSATQNPQRVTLTERNFFFTQTYPGQASADYLLPIDIRRNPQGGNKFGVFIPAGATTYTFDVAVFNEVTAQNLVLGYHVSHVLNDPNETIRFRVKSATGGVKVGSGDTITIREPRRSSASLKSTNKPPAPSSGQPGGTGALIVDPRPVPGPTPTFNASAGSGSLDEALSGLGSLNLGLLNGAEAFLDTNGNLQRDYYDADGDGTLSEGDLIEPIFESGLDGSVTILIPEGLNRNLDGTISLDEGQLVVRDGTDTSTDQVFESILIAPTGYFVVSPLTTLVTQIMHENGDDAHTAEQRLFAAFALPDFELATTSYLWDAADGDLTAGEGYRTDVTLAATSRMVAAVFEATDARDIADWSLEVYRDLAGKVAAPGSTANLSEASFVESLIRGVAFRAASSVATDVISAATRIIAEFNSLVEDQENDGTRVYVDSLAKLHKTAETKLVPAIRDLASSPDPSSVADANTGSGLQSAIDATTVSNVLPPEIYLADASVYEGDNGQAIAALEIGLVGSTDQPVSVDFGTADGTATVDDGDYEATGGVITWTPGGPAVQTIEIPIHGDTLFESDEIFSVQLSNPDGVVLRHDYGNIFILNDEPLEYSAADSTEAVALRAVLDGSILEIYQDNLLALSGEFDGTQPIRIVGATNAATSLEIEVASPGSLTAAGVVFIGGNTANDSMVVLNSTLASTSFEPTDATSGSFEFPEGAVSYSRVESIADMLTANIEIDGPALEGSELTLSAQNSAFPIVDDDSVQWTVERASTVVATGSGADFVFTPTDEGSYEIRAAVTRSGGGIGESTASVNVLNVAPQFEAGPSDTLLPPVVGAFMRNDIAITDPGNDKWSGTVNYGDSPVSHPLTIDQDTKRFDLAHTYDTEGTYTVTVTVDDGDGGTHSDSFEVTVLLNTPPVAVDDEFATNEETAVTLSVLANDTDAQDNLLRTATIALTTPAAGTLAANGDGSFTFDPTGAFDHLGAGNTAEVSFAYQIEDTFGETSVATASISVTGLNDAPTISSLASSNPEFDSRSVDGSVSIAGAFADLDLTDEHSITVDWGDGTAVEPISFAQDGSVFAAQHTYEFGGLFKIEVTVTDSQGEAAHAMTSAVTQGVGMVDGVLYVIGTDDRDKVQIDPRRRDEIRVKSKFGKSKVQRSDFELADIRSIVVMVGDGRDRVEVDRRLEIPATVFGGAGDDRIRTGRGNDFVDGQGGNDFIETDGGDDVITDLTGHNVVWSGAGDDSITTGDGNDFIVAGRGNDIILAGDGRNVVWAGDGSDLVLAGSGNDWIEGGRGNDLLIGGAGRDLLLGGRGRDLIIGSLVANAHDHASLQAALAHWNDGDLDAALADLGQQTDDDDFDWLLGGRGANKLFGDPGDWAWPL